MKGLKPDQFTVTDDGRQQKISIFSYEDIEAVETAPDSDTTPIVVAGGQYAERRRRASGRRTGCATAACWCSFSI